MQEKACSEKKVASFHYSILWKKSGHTINSSLLMRADTRWKKLNMSSQHLATFQIWFERLFDKDGKRRIAAHAYFWETQTPLPAQGSHAWCSKSSSTKVTPSGSGSGNQSMTSLPEDWRQQSLENDFVSLSWSLRLLLFTKSALASQPGQAGPGHYEMCFQEVPAPFQFAQGETSLGNRN